MDEITQIIEMCGHPDSEAVFHLSVTDRGTGNKKIALEYLKRYFISEEDYIQKWKPVQNSIFQNEKVGLPEKVFKDEFSLIAIRGGILFEREDFENLQSCIKVIGDKSWVIIQNDFGGTVKRPLLRMKYPLNVTWEELMNGNFVSTVLFEMSANEYFVFSESGSWGKYSANDYEYPLDIIGFKPELTTVFQKYFKQPEREKIREWLPQEYKALIKMY
jgi:hypothetical protein